ncbi:hypothetical protein J7E62_27535 [Variovorax paradoxus]|nr:hypothetical protein [Variovorax paradoxus]
MKSEHETFNDALIECVKKAGGSKVVGKDLWPAMEIESAQRKLLACLNADRHEKLSPEEVLFVLRKAREKGHHGGFAFMAEDLGYAEPVPVEPRDELADLIRQYLARKEADSRKDDRVERLLAQHLSQHTTLRVAA